MPTKEEVREILKGRIEEYERQLKPLPESLPYPDLPPEPDWGKIGWHHFNGANFQDCVLSRFVAPNLASYVNSPYCDKRKVLSGEEVHKLDLLSDMQLNRLSQEILNRVRAKKTCKIDWGKVGKVAVIVACGAGVVALTIASAGTVAVGAGATAASLGASSAVVSTVSTAATIGTYTVAGGIAATTVCDAEEVITDGHNTIRDNMIAPLAGQEHASEIYDNSKLMLTLASLGITQFAADNPQFRPLPKNKNLQAQINPNLDPKANPDLKLQTENELDSKTLLKPGIQSFVEEAETEVEADLEQVADSLQNANWNSGENRVNCIPDLSNTAVKHAMNDHMPVRYANQLRYLSKDVIDQYLSYKTFFNPSWTDDQVKEALNLAYKEALNSNVITGKYSFKYLEENVTVYLQNSVFKTGYGEYVYTYDELLKLLGEK